MGAPVFRGESQLSSGGRIDMWHSSVCAFRFPFLVLILTGGLLVASGCRKEPGEPAPAAGSSTRSPGSAASATFTPPAIDVTALPLPLQMKFTSARSVVNRNPEDAEAVGRLGALALAQGYLDEAIPLFERARTLRPDAPRWRYALARAYEAKKQQDAAIRMYEMLAGDEKPYPPALLRLAALVGDQDAARARVNYEAVLKQEDRAAQLVAHAGLGLLALRAQNAVGAEQHFRDALAMEPGYIPARTGLHAALVAQGKAEEAAPFAVPGVDEVVPMPLMDTYEEELLREGLDMATLLRYADRLLERGQFRELEETLQTAADVDRSGVVGRHALGRFRLMQANEAKGRGESTEYARRLRDARENFAQARRDVDGKVFGPAVVSLAVTYLAAHEFEAAEQVLREDLAAAPEDTNLVNALAWLQATRPDGTSADREESLTMAQQAVQSMTNVRHEVFDTLAAALAAVGRFDDAVQEIERAIAMAERVNAGQLSEYRQRRALYEQRKPYVLE